jgi:hypothetical protein
MIHYKLAIFKKSRRATKLSNDTKNDFPYQKAIMNDFLSASPARPRLI